MKLAIAFLAFGAAMAVPQNFYLSFHPPKNQFLPAADSGSQNAFRGPLNLDVPYQRNGYGFLPKSPFGNSFYDEGDFHGANDHRPITGNAPAVYSSQDEDVTEARNGVQSRFLFGGGGNGVGVGLYPFFPNFSRKFITIYAYSSTVNTTVTMAVVSTCIPTASLTAPGSTAPCAVGRKRRSFWDAEDLEAIQPSNVEDVVATAAEELPSIDRPVRDLQIESSQDDRQISFDTPNRRKRFFFGFVPTITLTSILTTLSTSTAFTQITNTTTLTQYSSFTCLPPGTVLCK